MPDLIAIATYRRNELLRRCLESCLPQIGKEDRVLVVDNDPAGAAHELCCSMGRDEPRLHYIHEPSPGIAAARNAALDFFHSNAFDALVFIDDDETAASDLLEKHRAAQQTGGRFDASFGPVEPVYSADVPMWVRKLDFFARTARSRHEVKWPATNNVRMVSSIFDKAPGIRFSEDWSMTGGSDSHFFAQARDHGARFVWVEEAVVRESVRADRANVRWLWRRGVRLGNVSCRMHLRSGRTRQWVAAGAAARLVLTPVLVATQLARRQPPGPALMNIPKAVGMIGALRGMLRIEYARSDVDSSQS